MLVADAPGVVPHEQPGRTALPVADPQPALPGAALLVVLLVAHLRPAAVSPQALDDGGQPGGEVGHGQAALEVQVTADGGLPARLGGQQAERPGPGGGLPVEPNAQRRHGSTGVTYSRARAVRPGTGR